MVFRRLLPLVAATTVLLACHTAPTAAAADGPATAAAAADEKGSERRQKQKDLRQKQRELDHHQVEQQVAEIDRSVRAKSAERAVAKTKADLEAARRELEVFQRAVRPREIEQKQLNLDAATYRAEHQKDELGELTAMYDADEFARTTKELVLKRGRREVEMAERNLAVAHKELAHLEQHELPQRERELQDKVTQAELELWKAETEVQKMSLEHGLAVKKAQERLVDLNEEIAALQQALAKEKT